MNTPKKKILTAKEFDEAFEKGDVSEYLVLNKLKITYHIRKAKPQEADQLTKLALRSKSFWGYKKELVEAWIPELTITTDNIKQNISYVAELNNKIKGFYIQEATEQKLSASWLFIEPDAIGTGCGQQLWETVINKLKEHTLSSFAILVDPNALGFYENMGGQKIGEHASDIIKGRKLPIVKFTLR